MTWTFLTNHSLVLRCIVENPDARVRDIADQVGITERATRRIIADLEYAGYVSHEKIGRRNHYVVDAEISLRHPLEVHLRVGDLLDVLLERR